ncbi:MAG: FimB/Mfa2 family fimbrial subunit [Dysgonamonadaceae bacterium]|jgi:hypothetical protein|nr:FimB/Mfa2 family fimbrial subunit [Dysgonamonadaceae bacterium]
MFRKIVIFSLLALLCSSCIKQDLSDCVLRLEFSYTYNKSGQNQIGQIRDIQVYVFDSKGVLYEVIRATQQDITRGYVEITLPSDTYTAVAWGSSSTNMMGSYKVAEMTAPATHTYTPQVTTGVTTLNNFRKMLSYEQLPSDVYGDITPQNEQFDDLFYAIAQNFPVVEGRNQTVSLNFMKNTSILKVKVTGLQNLRSTRAPHPNQPLQLFVAGKNGRFGYDNSIDNSARTVRYEPPATTVAANDMAVDVKVQRLIIDRHRQTDPVELHIEHPETGTVMRVPLNVVETILAARDASNNPVWANQEAIDKEDEFTIEVSILHDANIGIKVNGFEIVDLTPELRP